MKGSVWELLRQGHKGSDTPRAAEHGRRADGLGGKWCLKGMFGFIQFLVMKTVRQTNTEENPPRIQSASQEVTPQLK